MKAHSTGHTFNVILFLSGDMQPASGMCQTSGYDICSLFQAHTRHLGTMLQVASSINASRACHVKPN